MKIGSWFRWRWCLWVLAIVAWDPAALAIPPSTPITIELELSRVPNLQEWAVLTVKVQSILAAPDTHVELMLPEGVDAETMRWVVDLEANIPVTLTSAIVFQKPGNLTISARALKVVDSGAVWGDMKSIPLYIGSSAAEASEMGWKVDRVPVALLAERGDTDPISMKPIPFSFPAPAEEAPSPQELPSVAPAQTPNPASFTPSSPGTVTLTGKWQYRDRSSVVRDLDQQLIEIRRGDGDPLSPSVYCFTQVDGSFSCSFPHPGTTMRIWARSYTNFSIPGTTNRLGVFAGPEVASRPPGCTGSDVIDCSYAYTTGEIMCADSQTCNTGTHTIAQVEPEGRAHQMTQDLIRSWKKLWFDTRDPAGTTAGPARIQYPAPPLPDGSLHTHAHVPPADGWISIQPPSGQSGDVVTHEYGHVVMANLWAGFLPQWPTNDCPSPHFIQSVSGPGCALSEGFANFWAWYGNEFYDGDDVTWNDGPIFNWQPGMGGTNMETRDNGTYDAGDQVEGNVAAALGDIYDTANDGPAQGPADRLSDGIQHIWHVTSSQSDNNFLEWWTAYWSTFSHEPCATLDALRFNTIQYSHSDCSDTTNTAPFGHIDVPAPGASVQGSLNVEGWVLDREDSSLTVELLVDGGVVSSSPSRFARPDVCGAFPSVSHCASSNPGVRFSWNTTTVSNGAHTLALRVTDPKEASATVGSRTVTVNNSTSNTAPFGNIDVPAPGASVQGTINVEGWVLDREDSSLTVELLVDGGVVSSSPSRFARPDVCAAFPSVSHCASSNPGVRFSWNTTTGVSNGSHSLAFRVTDSQGASATVGTRTVTVNNSTSNTAPFGNIDVPASGATVQGSLNVEGWVLDREDSSLTVQLLVDNNVVSSSPTRFPRPDVCGVVVPPVSHCARSNPGVRFSWNTTTVSDGAHTLALRVTDPQGASATVGTRTVTVNNSTSNTAPFGSIDVPAPGASVQGTTNVEGWVLDREDGSLTVELLVDGNVVSSSPSRFARPDVCGAFASISHCSSSNPGVRFPWNTTTVSNGSHSLAFKVTDPQGASATVGTRTVTVNNTISLRFEPNPALQSSFPCSGVTPAWNYTAFLTETAGVGVTITRFTWDFYGSSGNFLNTQTNTATDFANWFNSCGPGSAYIPPSATVCGNLCAHLGGLGSGSVVMTFYGRDDAGQEVSVSGREVLSSSQGVAIESKVPGIAGGSSMRFTK